MKKGKILLLMITLLLCISTFKIYAKENDNSYSREYSTYKNAIERLMISLLNKKNLNSSDIALLKSLNRAESSKTLKLLVLDEEYKETGDNRLLQIKNDLSIELSMGLDHTYKNAIEKLISKMLKNKELSDIEISFMQKISSINTEQNTNKKKVEKLEELKKEYKKLSYDIDSIINELKSESPIPPSVSELKEKTLIIGEYIIYMPSLTTDNLMIANNTLGENQNIYYKSEFLDGKWISMTNVNEIYHLMVNDSYKVVDDEKILDNIEYMAYINEDGELIEYRKFKEYIASLNDQGAGEQEDSDESDELADDLNTQLTKAQSANLENSLSNVFAESRTLEAKIDAVEDLYEETKDDRLQQLIKNLKNDIDAQQQGGASDDRYNNSIKEFVDNLSGTDLALIDKLERINGVPQSVKEERQLRQQLLQAEAQNNTLEADTIKLLLGMEVKDNSIDLKKIADEFRSEGLVNIAAMVQGESFSSEEINSIKPFDEQFNNMIASAILLSNGSAENADSDIADSISNNKDKNRDLLKNLMDSSLATIISQCNSIIDDRGELTKQLVNLNKEKDNLVSDLEASINSGEREKTMELLTGIQQISEQIQNVQNKIDDGNQTIQNLCSNMNTACNEINLPILKTAKEEFDKIEESNKDYLVKIVDLMIKRYILVEEYKVEKSKEHTASMSKLRNEISDLDYQINYILSLKILDQEYVNIEYNIRLAQLLKDNVLYDSYTYRKSVYIDNNNKKINLQNEIIKKAEKFIK